MKQIKSINGTAALNIASTVLLQGVAFLSTPIFTRVLGVSQYGLYSVYNSWVTILACIMGLGTGAVLGTGMYAFKEKYYCFRSSTLLLGTLISLTLIALTMAFAPWVAKTLEYSALMLGLILIAAFSHYVVTFFQNACIYERKAVDNFVVSVLISVSTVGLSLLLITRYPWENKYLGRVYGGTIPYIIVGVIVWIKIFFKEKTWLRRAYCRFALCVGFPVVFHSLAQNILGQSDRVMMQFAGIASSEIGIYSLFYSITMVLNTILSALNTSWCPFYYEDVDAQAWEKLDVKCKNYIELFTVLTVGFTLLSREGSYLMADESFRGGLNLIPILVFAVYFTFMYQFPVNFEFFHKRTKIIACGTIGAGVLNIALNACMIPAWGMYGAAIATSISYGALFIMHYVIVRRMKEHPYHLHARVFVPGLAAATGACILYFALADKWYIRWGMGCALGIYEIFRIYKRKTIF